MKTFFPRIGVATAALAMLAAPALANDGERAENEVKLAKMLEGRVAGEPQTCINLRNAQLRVLEDVAIVYEVGSTVYVNVPRNPEQLDDNDMLVTRSISNRLCRQDIVTTVRRAGGFYSGNIFLGDFVPYRKEG